MGIEVYTLHLVLNSLRNLCVWNQDLAIQPYELVNLQNNKETSLCFMQTTFIELC